MFTGIIEAFAKVKTLNKVGENLQIKFECNLAEELKIDQSVSHNGVCLTVEKCEGKYYSVTAIKETLDKTNLGLLQIGDYVNIERSLKIGDRLSLIPGFGQRDRNGLDGYDRKNETGE